MIQGGFKSNMVKGQEGKVTTKYSSEKKRKRSNDDDYE